MSQFVQDGERLDSSAARRACALSFEAGDLRADGLRRSVRLNPEQVTIARRLAGMRMKISVPSKSYRGVVLEPAAASRTRRFRLRLDHRDPDLNVPLFEAADAADVIAEWTGWAQFFALPRLIETSCGGLACLDQGIGRVLLGASSPERRQARTVGARRPRFLARRKTGATPASGKGRSADAPRS